MNTPRSCSPLCLTAAFILALLPALAEPPATDAKPGDLPHVVKFELGDARFAPGDNITILQVRGTSETIAVGETYSVEGTYTLGSRDEADLAFYCTTISRSGPTSVDAKQHVRVKKGSGSFRLVKTMGEDGYLHVSFYPVSSGGGFGGVYFGQGERVLRNRANETARHGDGGASEEPVLSSGPNQILFRYLGNPVEPPPNMDVRYDKEGLIAAIKLASRKAGITVRKVDVDDTEYPFLVGVVCAGSDATALKTQLRQMEGYQYNGSVGNDANADGSDTCNVFTLDPYPARPAYARRQIDHRLLLREQVFYDVFSSRE
jgi:hypothetical protein